MTDTEFRIGWSMSGNTLQQEKRRKEYREKEKKNKRRHELKQTIRNKRQKQRKILIQSEETKVSTQKERSNTPRAPRIQDLTRRDIRYWEEDI